MSELSRREFEEKYGAFSKAQFDAIHTGKIPLSHVPLSHPYWDQANAMRLGITLEEYKNGKRKVTES